MSWKKDSLRSIPCKLCDQLKPLVRSHIIPEWCYEPLYSGNHKLALFELGKAPRRRTYQSGVKEHMLCSDCDQRFGVWEKYVREVLHGPVEVQVDKREDHALITGLNYKKFKLFGMSMLWRASVSKHKTFENVMLGTDEQELRQMLLSSDPGTALDYGVCVFGLQSETTQEVIVDGLIVSPEILEVAGWSLCRFIVAGFAWFFLLCHGNGTFGLNDHLLTENGTLKVYFVTLENTGLFKGLAENLPRGSS